jgi:uncharacterized protein YbjQ (UPF0145 family)
MAMIECKKCKEFIHEKDLVEGYCFRCVPADMVQKFDEKEKQLKQENIEKNLNINSILITTETSIDIPIEERIEVVFSEYVYGLNIIKDFFTGIRDVVGGRVKSIEQPIQDTNQKIIQEMKEKAYNLGGDAVIGLKFDYSIYTGMVSIIAVGTVVKLKKIKG